MCAVDTDTDKVDFWEVPVVGWAVVRTQYRDEAEDEIKLFVFDDDSARAVDETIGEHVETETIAPGEEFTDVWKTNLEARVRRKMARAQKTSVAA